MERTIWLATLRDACPTLGRTITPAEGGEHGRTRRLGSFGGEGKGEGREAFVLAVRRRPGDASGLKAVGNTDLVRGAKQLSSPLCFESFSSSPPSELTRFKLCRQLFIELASS